MLRRVFARSSPSASPVARGERILAGSAEGDLIATLRALYHRAGSAPWARIGWEDMERVLWRPDTDVLTVRHLSGRVVVIRGPGDGMAGIARDLVAAALVATVRVPIGTGGARIAVRRAPESDSLVWMVHLSPDLRPADPAVRSLVDEAIRAVRADLGL